MLLGQVVQALPAWQKLSTLRMTPFMAYQLLKYSKLVAAECDVSEKQRVALIHELTNTKDGEQAKIELNTPEFSEYVNKFNEILSVECELNQSSFALDDVLGAIKDDKENTLTVQELAVLEPFFKEK